MKSNHTHIEIKAELDYKLGPCPHCQGKMSKYDFQKPSTIILLDTQGIPTALKLKKRRFQCKECRRVVVVRNILGPQKLPNFAAHTEENC